MIKDWNINKKDWILTQKILIVLIEGIIIKIRIDRK